MSFRQSIGQAVSSRRNVLLSAGVLAGLGTVSGSDVDRPGATLNTRFAVNVEMWFGGKSFLEKIELAAKYGYPAIEFWPWENKPLAEAARRRGFSVHGLAVWKSAEQSSIGPR